MGKNRRFSPQGYKLGRPDGVPPIYSGVCFAGGRHRVQGPVNQQPRSCHHPVQMFFAQHRARHLCRTAFGWGRRRPACPVRMGAVHVKTRQSRVSSTPFRQNGPVCPMHPQTCPQTCPQASQACESLAPLGWIQQGNGQAIFDVHKAKIPIDLPCQIRQVAVAAKEATTCGGRRGAGPVYETESGHRPLKPVGTGRSGFDAGVAAVCAGTIGRATRRRHNRRRRGR
jgi:hypothetical protein